MLQASSLEDHMKTIDIYQLLFTKSSFEHRCMNNIKNIYQHAVKCDDEQNITDIIDVAMVSTPELVTDNSPNVPITSTPLCLFTKILNVTLKTEKLCIVDAKSKHRSIKVDNILCTKKTKRKGH